MYKIKVVSKRNNQSIICFLKKADANNYKKYISQKKQITLNKCFFRKLILLRALTIMYNTSYDI